MGLAVGALQEAAAQKERLFLWAPVCFGGGIAAYFALSIEPALWVALPVVAAGAAGAACLYRRQYDGAALFLSYLLCLAVMIAGAGFAVACAATHLKGTPVLQKGVGPVTVGGMVESVDALEKGEGRRVVLSQVRIEGLAPEETPRKVRLKFRNGERLEAGAVVETLARLDPPSQAVAPGAYDFRRHLFFEGIGGVGFAYRQAQVTGEKTGGAGQVFEKAREAIDARIKNGAGAVAGGIMSALVTGERGAIAEQDNDAMRESGLYHLLSISGTHVCMVAGVLFFMVRLALAAWPWAALHWPIKKIAAVAALAGAAFYVFLAGAEVPAQRALLMTGLVMVAVMLDRSPFSLRLIAFSALVVLAAAPYALIGVSFQMSYAAVAALICFFEYTRGWWMAWKAKAGWFRKSVLYLLALMITSFIAGTVTGLFSLYHFQAFSVYGVLSNMIAVPLTGVVIMPAAVLAVFLMPLGLEGPALQVMEWGTLWMLAIAHWTAGLDGAVIKVSQWPQAVFTCFACGTILFLVWSGWRGKGVAAAMIAVGFVIAAFSARPDVMVSGTGKAMAVRSGEDVYVSSGRREKFVLENWMRLSGQEGEEPKLFSAAGSPVACDGDGCRAEINGHRVSIVRNAKALAEDCGWAEVILSEGPIRRKDCTSGALLLGLYDFREGGAHAIYFGKDVRVRKVMDETGLRPWSKQRAIALSDQHLILQPYRLD